MFDLKYNTRGPNILWGKPGLGSPFWKGITWAFSAARAFYYWKVGMERVFPFGMMLDLVNAHLKSNFGIFLRFLNNKIHQMLMAGICACYDVNL